MIDFMFVTDLILGFFTSYMDLKGHEIKNYTKIFHHQTSKTVFYTDFLLICGNGLFQKLISPSVGYLQMFKLFRIFKLNTMIISSNLTKNQKTYGLIFKLILYLILWFHSLACGWWIIIGIDANVEYMKERDGITGHDYWTYSL